MRRLRFQIAAVDRVAAYSCSFDRSRCSGDVPESRGRQVETGLTVRESTDDAGSAPDLFHDPLQRIVGSDLLPVDVRKP
jgi:hypothetical protein